MEANKRKNGSNFCNIQISLEPEPSKENYEYIRDLVEKIHKKFEELTKNIKVSA